MTTFKDYFSHHASQYAQYRPTYPPELFSYLATLTSEHDLAWDCATGNGQVALGLTPYFQQIQATDASQQQLEHGVRHSQIIYRVATAEHPPFADRSIDLITVAQAVHWFQLEVFYAAVQRVLKLGGAIALWGYGFCELPTANPAIAPLLAAFYQEVEPFWPPEWHMLNQQYRTITFPFPEHAPPPLTMQAKWSAEQLLGYLATWSATQRWLAQTGNQGFAEFGQLIQSAWGDRDQLQPVRWPLFLRVGYLG